MSKEQISLLKTTWYSFVLFTTSCQLQPCKLITEHFEESLQERQYLSTISESHKKKRKKKRAEFFNLCLRTRILVGSRIVFYDFQRAEISYLEKVCLTFLRGKGTEQLTRPITLLSFMSLHLLHCPFLAYPYSSWHLAGKTNNCN